MSDKRRRVTTSKWWVERGPLTPWMLRYLQWLAQHPEAALSRARREGEVAVQRGRPYTQERTAAASKFACRKIPGKYIQLLERRADAVDYFMKLRADVQFQAREAMRQDLIENIEARREALQHSRARRVPATDAQGNPIEEPDGTIRMRDLPPDVKAIDSLTRWVPEVAFPKKERDQDQKPTIILHLGTAASKALLGIKDEEEDIQDIEWEEIPNEKLLGDGDDDAA